MEKVWYNFSDVGHVVHLDAKSQLHENCNRFLLSKYLQSLKQKMWEGRTLDESEYFLMCRERHIKVNGAAEVEEKGAMKSKAEPPLSYTVWCLIDRLHTKLTWASDLSFFTSPCRSSPSFSSFFYFSERRETWGGPRTGWNGFRLRPALRGVTGKQRPFR